MAADYSKACDHENIEKRPFAQTWVCTDCGADVPAGDSVAAELPTYAEALRDARTLNWRRVPQSAERRAREMPTDRAYYTAWQERPWGASESRWRVERVEAGKTRHALAQWWADDLLGLPPCND